MIAHNLCIISCGKFVASSSLIFVTPVVMNFVLSFLVLNIRRVRWKRNSNMLQTYDKYRPALRTIIFISFIQQNVKRLTEMKERMRIDRKDILCNWVSLMNVYRQRCRISPNGVINQSISIQHYGHFSVRLIFYVLFALPTVMYFSSSKFLMRKIINELLSKYFGEDAV